ncbi:serine/threonine-protein kinase [Nostoc sp. FACHB-190]|uniref:serine/threonine-protein kinase n=1 Tax=Nostoc sp. FACHB-190 TaxID=2692838 RepID=UPI001681EE05|nr:serine/threonine-protein kinase [Nostoc sp. FACHB-190]MBD2302085.1 serine/threonine protein kinase [Nostoc sp. FACHB-190]
MVCCLNPDCSHPLNPDENQYCQSCNTPLVRLLRGHYRVIQVISDEGGFGRTYLAEDVDKLNEWCVVKQLAPKVQEATALKKAIALFQEEAQRLQHLGEHPQIPALLAYFEQDNYLFLVQQFIDGQNLMQELSQGVTYTEIQVRQVLCDLLPVLKFIHDRGVIHRDIKPQNIIRRRSDDKLVLIDFGASKQLTATVHTKLGTIIGSHGYTPIEQMQYGQAYPASDLYSLGVTCFYLLTGNVPSKLWMEQGYSWVKSWRQYLPNANTTKITIDAKLGKVLDKLLTTDMGQRYQTADQVLQDLKTQSSTSTNLFATAPTLLPVPRSKQLLTFKLNDNLQKLLLVNIFVILLGLGGIWYFQSFPQLNTTAVSENLDQPKTFRGHASDVNAVAFAPNRRIFASGSDDQTIKLWNLATGTEINTLKGHLKWIWAIAFHPDGKILASGSADKTIKLWNLATAEEIRTLTGHTDGVTAVAFSPNGKTLASGSLDQTIKLWDVTTGKLIRTLSGHNQAVASIAFSPNGKTLASGSWDKTIKLWNVATGKQIRTLEGHTQLILSLAFSPDGKTLASGSKDKTVKIWNIATGETIRTLKQHADKVNSVAYGKTGNATILASGSSDNTIKLWNPANGAEIRTLKRDSGYIYSVAISADGKAIASGGSADNIIKIWPISP